MATIVTYNEATTLDIEANTTVDGTVDGSGNLILERRNGTTFNGGSVGAPIGDQGPERNQPAGQISLYGGSVPPQGWAFCNGSAVSRVNFPDLFAAIGVQYGAGDGTSTFNLPNLNGRVAVGLDDTQTEFDTLGEQGGAKTHTLTEAELPAHTHTVLGYSSKDDENFTGNVGRMNASDAMVTAYDKPTLSVGGGGAHSNLQPYSTINFIIALGIAAPQGGGIPVPVRFKSTGRGTTAQRDTLYGVPTTDAARVALANQKVIWFNTTTGWEESYYALTGLSGLTATGLIAGTPSGWFPTGNGAAPYINLEPTDDDWVAWNELIGGYSVMKRKGGASWFTTTGDDKIQVLQHGRYDIKYKTHIYEGAGVPDIILKVLSSDGLTDINANAGGGFSKDATYWVTPHAEIWDLVITPGRQVCVRLQQGTMTGAAGMTMHLSTTDTGRGQLSVKYVGPPLVME